MLIFYNFHFFIYFDIKHYISNIKIMIQNFSRPLIQFIAFNLKTSRNILPSTTSLRFLSFNNQTFAFSTQKKPQKKVRDNSKNDSFSPIDYYRNTIRKVNIRSNGRGKFSAYQLSRIIGLSKTQQHAKIMFEAYFNYLGHFTSIPNQVVDTLIFKSIQIGNQTQQLLQIFSHHNYLTYFPHYDATNRFIKNLIKIQDQQNLQKMLRILIRSPLIKINQKTVNILIQHFPKQQCQPTTKEYILKILLFRRKLVEGINQEDLLGKISKALEESQAGAFQAKVMIRNAINELFEQNSISTQDNANRLILASTFEMIQQSGNYLRKETQQIGTQYERYLNYLISLHQRSSKQKNYGQILKEALAEAKLSVSSSQKLQELINGSG